MVKFEDKEFPCGAGVDSVKNAVQLRNNKMFKIMIQNAPPSKLKVLELGSGRGGLTRFVAQELKNIDRLESILALNITERENTYNLEKARELGLLESEFMVTLANFDNLDNFSNYDVIISNDSLMHAANKSLLCSEMARMLNPKGVIIFTDILQSEKADSDSLKEIYARLSLPDLASMRLYEDSLYRAGLQKIMTKEETQTIKRHYGFVLNKTLQNKNELLERGCEQEWLDK